MSTFLDRIGIRGSFRRNFGAIIMLALAGCAIFGLPFFRFEYYSAYLDTYHLTNTEMGVFGTVIGVFGIVSYLFGGVVADGLPVRKVIAVSLVATGVGGLLHFLPLNFYGLLAIYALWGISTTFAFQPACVKAVRVMADDDSQGKAYGFFEGVQGIGGAIVAMIALAIFNWGVATGDEVAAMRSAILFYSVVNIAMGIFAYFTIRDERMRLRVANMSFAGVAQVLKNPAVWIICLVAFCNHVLCLSVYYYIPYTTEVLGAAVAIGAVLGIVRKWGGVVGNISGGYLADFFGTKNLMLFAYIAVLVGQIIILILPVERSSVLMVAVLFALIFLAFSMNMTVSWTMMTEGAVPKDYSGTAAGLICMAGAIPETFVSVLAGRIIDANPGAAGYHYFFYFLVVVTALGCLLLLGWRFYLKSDYFARLKARVQAEDAASTCGPNSCHMGVNAVDEEASDVATQSQMACSCHLNVIDDDEPAASAAGACAAEVATRSQMSCRTHLNVIDDDDAQDCGCGCSDGDDRE